VASTTRPKLGSSTVRAGLHGEVQRLERRRLQVRATIIKEERADLVKHHLWSLDRLLQSRALKEFPNLHDLFWMATKSGARRRRRRVVVADRLLSEIDAIAELFWATKK